MLKLFKFNKKDASKMKVNCYSTRCYVGTNFIPSVSGFTAFSEKQLNVQYGIGSISMLISSHIHNAANRAIVKNSWQRSFHKTGK